ncbi:MAG: GntR family transcriptional regulator [Herbinix sp.]|nr:GntR family transcriptional regulator [Herbinix sp.]
MNNKDVFITHELNKFGSISEELKAKGYNFHYKIMDMKVIESNRYISRQLSIPLASKVFYLKKIRIVKEEPKTIENVYIDCRLVDGFVKEQIDDVSFYHVLEEKYGYKTIRSEEEILIVEASEEERNLLHLKGKEEILLIKGITYIDNIKPFEYFEISSVTDFYHFRSVKTI